MAKRKIMNQSIPRLIVFEGIDGSGKTTISKRLFDYYRKNRQKILWLREPSDSQWGKKIRELANQTESIPIEEELFYFIEDRKINVKQNIIPALRQNKIVILDRYFFSTACYQGARGLNMAQILATNREFAPEPDIIFIIDVDVNTALARIKKNRDTEVLLFEKKEFLQKVRANYLSLKGEKALHVIDGTGDPDAVFNRVKEIILSYNKSIS